MRIAEVRRYISVQDMVAELAADLLPDVADARTRIKVYESLYGDIGCARGFVAMRLEFVEDEIVHEKYITAALTSCGA